jgi:hypothetical protein
MTTLSAPGTLTNKLLEALAQLRSTGINGTPHIIGFSTAGFSRFGRDVPILADVRIVDSHSAWPGADGGHDNIDDAAIVGLDTLTELRT